MDDALDTCQLRLARNFGTERQPGMANSRREERCTEIASNDGPQAFVGTTSQSHLPDDLVTQQGVRIAHRVLEKLLLCFEIVMDNAF
ncbi:hypothetical protein AJ88_31445 [Mesorhizobium amorphae CCBAU 01583]|nr:hypothetical protein AJ88_31445 [Mesorhizobium amorphae CCBAU 01583]